MFYICYLWGVHVLYTLFVRCSYFIYIICEVFMFYTRYLWGVQVLYTLFVRCSCFIYVICEVFMLYICYLWGIHVLYTLFVFIYVYWCSKRFPFLMMFVSFNSNTTGVTSGAATASAPEFTLGFQWGLCFSIFSLLSSVL